jgi:hypothetical protein
MKICKYCGSENSSNNKFCIHCGAALEETAGGASTNRDYYARMHEEKRAEQAAQNESGERIIYTNVAPRSVALSVILTIATCGIYMLYWQYKLNNEVNDLAEDSAALGGGMVVVLSIVTFGIYNLYWLYKMGQKCDYIRQHDAYSAILYLILGVFGLGIVSFALIQDSINKVLE